MMEPESGERTIANRGEAIPVIQFFEPDNQPDASSSESESHPAQQKRFWEQGSKTGGKAEGRQSLQDRVFTGIITQIIGSGEVNETSSSPTKDEKKKEKRSKKSGNERPEFGPRLLANNFRRFNARIGVLFVFESELIQLLSWRRPTATLSLLAVYSLVCLKPILIPVLPLVGVMVVMMIPAFLARHPTPANDPRMEPSFYGPATAPPSRTRPAPEFSADFWRNMRDLQNTIEDYSRIHDALNLYVAPYTNFSNEPLSSSLFLGVFVLTWLAFVGSAFLPYQLIALVVGWVLILAGHPQVQQVLFTPWNISQLQQHLTLVQTSFRNWYETDILMDEPPAVRQVEIFELQKHHADSDTWESWLFSPTPYDPLSQPRMVGERPKGTQFFEDVQAPAGWSWKDKKWNLDLFSREWIERRMINGVEIETEGERWVYDIPPAEVDSLRGSATKGKKAAQAAPKSGWEESNGVERHGEWRRRRWVRSVERKAP